MCVCVLRLRVCACVRMRYHVWRPPTHEENGVNKACASACFALMRAVVRVCVRARECVRAFACVRMHVHSLSLPCRHGPGSQSPLLSPSHPLRSPVLS